jgi:hypothetical protein
MALRAWRQAEASRQVADPVPSAGNPLAGHAGSVSYRQPGRMRVLVMPFRCDRSW